LAYALGRHLFYDQNEKTTYLMAIDLKNNKNNSENVHILSLSNETDQSSREGLINSPSVGVRYL
jgi:uncharacterized protein YrzB (UPF0473 family)